MVENSAIAFWGMAHLDRSDKNTLF
jgi:hypothetical protein